MLDYREALQAVTNNIINEVEDAADEDEAASEISDAIVGIIADIYDVNQQTVAEDLEALVRADWRDSQSEDSE